MQGQPTTSSSDRKRVQEIADRLERRLYEHLKLHPPKPPAKTLDDFKGSMIYPERSR